MKIKLNIGAKKEYGGSLLGTILVFIFFSVMTDSFFTVYNLLNVFKNASILLIASIGTTMAIILGKNDISIGSIMSLTGVVTAILMRSGYSTVFAIIVGLSLGLLCGIINGYLIAYVKADFWITTFAMMSLAHGFSLVLSNGNSISGFAQGFRFLGSGKLLGVYFLTWLTGFTILLMLFILRKTKFGYNIYAVGDNEECAVLSGLNSNKIVLGVFSLSGLFAAIAGLLLASKANSAMPTGGSGYEFDAIAAVLIGGTSFSGGTGGLEGTIIGVLLITILRNGLTAFGLASIWQYIIIGVVIMAVIIFDVTRTRLKENKNRGMNL